MRGAAIVFTVFNILIWLSSPSLGVHLPHSLTETASSPVTHTIFRGVITVFLMLIFNGVILYYVVKRNKEQ